MGFIEKRKTFIFCFVLGLAGFLLYLPNLKNTLFWDDADWILNNPFVHNFSLTNLKFIFSHDALAGIGLASNYYRPVLFLSFMFNYIISGTNPVSYHLVNNFIHISNGILIFLILDKFLRKRLAAFIAGFLFIIHPLQTEAVAYVSGRGDPMAIFFMLLALWLFMKNRMMPNRVNRYFFGSVIFAALAILSRETAFLFPIYLIIFLTAFIYKEKFWPSINKSIKETVPFLGLSLFYGILRLTVFNFHNTLNFYQKSNIYTEHLSYRIYTFFNVLAVYFQLIFAPIRLHMERDVLVNTSLFQWPVWVGVLVVAVILCLLFYFYKNEKISLAGQDKISNFRIWFFAWGVFFINLAPTSGVFPINALIYEHWLYFSLFGFFALVSFYLDDLFVFLRLKIRPLFYVAVVLLLIYASFFGFQTVKRNIIWGKTDKFYEDILNYEPKNVRVLNNLANYYSDLGQPDKAEPLLLRAINADDTQAAPYYNLANILRDRKDYAGAIELYKKSISTDKYFPFAYTNLASVYVEQGDLTKALDYLEQLKQIEPSNYGVYYNLGILSQAMGRKDNAIKYLEFGLKLVRGQPHLEDQFNTAIRDLK